MLLHTRDCCGSSLSHEHDVYTPAIASRLSSIATTSITFTFITAAAVAVSSVRSIRWEGTTKCVNNFGKSGSSGGLLACMREEGNPCHSLGHSLLADSPLCHSRAQAGDSYPHTHPCHIAYHHMLCLHILWEEVFQEPCHRTYLCACRDTDFLELQGLQQVLTLEFLVLSQPVAQLQCTRFCGRPSRCRASVCKRLSDHHHCRNRQTRSL